MIFRYNDISEINEVAKRIIEFCGDSNIWILKGNMGAGKTTLVSAIVNELGSTDRVSSPTFSLVNEYLTDKNELIYHFDFYRVESEMEAIDMGCDEYFYSGNLCLIEWPEKIPSLIPSQNIEINIKLVEENHREIHLIKNV